MAVCVVGREASSSMMMTVLTIGHSTRAIAELMRLLEAHGVERVIDVRQIPRSAHNPQFSRERLARALRRSGIHYLHMPGLGGRRHPRRDSINTGWRNASFRGYADYMQTERFSRSLDRCISFARREQIALMCAEAVPWRCHRSLIAARLARDFGRKTWGDEGYAREELVAELGSAFLCADLELTPEVREDHASYIASWDWGDNTYEGKKPELSMDTAIGILKAEDWIAPVACSRPAFLDCGRSCRSRIPSKREVPKYVPVASKCPVTLGFLRVLDAAAWGQRRRQPHEGGAPAP